MKKLFVKILLTVTAVLLIAGCTGNKKDSFDIAGKTFYNTVDEFGNAEHSKLWFGKDGSFVLTDNFSEGSYEISGKW